MRCGLPETGSSERLVRTVGSYLREVRESKGIGLEEAAAVTRIGKNYLLAIEGEMYDKLPSAAYIKGFLRVYAGYLGLSGDEVVAIYDKSRASQQTRPLRESDKDEALREDKPITSTPGRWLVPLVLLVAVVVAAYIVGDKEEKTNKGPAPATSRSQTVALPTPVQAARSSSAKKPGPAPAVAETRTALPVAADGGRKPGIILRLKVNQDCWLNITIDNIVSQQYDLKAGDLIEWKGEKVFDLDIGNAGGVEGQFNGTPLKPFGEPGKTAHVILKAQGT
jgi:transcriptional regulator with XRE-family HTH domain